MKITIGRDLFIDELSKYYNGSHFSKYAKHLLFEHFEEIEAQLQQEIEINFVDICCDWSEDKLSKTLNDYNLSSVYELEEKTEVIKTYFLEDDIEYVLYKKF